MENEQFRQEPTGGFGLNEPCAWGNTGVSVFVERNATSETTVGMIRAAIECRDNSGVKVKGRNWQFYRGE